MMSETRYGRTSREIALLLLLAALAFAAGCSSANTEGVSGGTSANHIDASGQSVPGWLVLPTGGQHASSATLNFVADGNLSACAECHGADLSGGISRVSCFQNAAGCHHGPVAGWVAAPPSAQEHGLAAKRAPGSSGFASCRICHGAAFGGGGSQVSCFTCHGVSAPHPAAPWIGAPYTHADTVQSNIGDCALCHFPGSPNNPAGFPGTPAPAGTPPGCFNATVCHDASAAPHASPYIDVSHFGVSAAAFTGSCGPCHDVSAPTTKVGPACQACHAAASPLTSLNCTSCHAAPPNGAAPAGAAYPNIAGAHVPHGALGTTGGAVSCDVCHDGLGSGTLTHYNAAVSRTPPGDAAFQAAYNAESGAASFDNAAFTCSNVSCHGGQTTPSWRTGAIDVNNQCLDCHAAGGTQFNSFNSGEHNLHLAAISQTASTCRTCHNTSTLAVNHFAALDTPAMEGPASATIGGAGTQINMWNPATRSCTPTCHGNETW